MKPTETVRIPSAIARGFTLLELLVVLAILGLIAAFAAPQALKLLGGAKADSAQIQLQALATGIDLYRLEVGSYPPSLEGLVEKPSGVDTWNGPYIRKKEIPKDPWGGEYVYRVPGADGDEYDLLSLGSDKAEGGEGEQADVSRE